MLKTVSICNYLQFLSQLKSTLAKYLQELAFTRLRQCQSIVNEIDHLTAAIESIPSYTKKYSVPKENIKEAVQKINEKSKELDIKYHEFMEEAERLDKKASQLILSSNMHLNQANAFEEDVTVLVDFEKVVREFLDSLVQEFNLDSNDLSLYYQNALISGLGNQTQEPDTRK